MADKTVLIAGAGTFGLSTAWHLARSGKYKSITVLDKHPAPSVASAGHDLNKIFRTEYSDPIYSALSHEARDSWLSEATLKGLYHECGYIFSVCGKSEKSVQNYEQAVANSRKNGVAFDELDTPEAFRAKCKTMIGPLAGWRGVYNPKAGWMHARKALEAIKSECDQLGVKFLHGSAGEVTKVHVAASGGCTGVVTANGSVVSGDIVVLALGAWLDSVIDTQGQSLAKAWCFAHIDLTEEGAAQWKNAPVINNRELGYIFEPDEEGRKLKIAPHGVGYTHYSGSGRSQPRCKLENPTDGIPDESRALLRELLRECLPNLADRPFSYERLCWDADTMDAHFLLTPHPDHSGLFLAGGGSAHGFKFLPTIGKYVKMCIEDTLPSHLKEIWQWRPHKEAEKDYARPDKPAADLRDLPGWQTEPAAQRV